MDYIFVVVALALIVVGAMLLTDGSVALAERMKVPQFIVGLTIMAVGTSMPELMITISSAKQNVAFSHNELVTFESNLATPACYTQTTAIKMLQTDI